MRTPTTACGLLVLAFLAGPLRGHCTTPSSASPVPADRWGDLEPRSILGDNTCYRFNHEPDCSDPMWFDLAHADGLLFAVNGSAFEIYDTTTNPAQPPKVKSLCRPVRGTWLKTDQDFYATSIAVPPGDGTIAIVGLQGGMGVAVIDTTTPSQAFVRYQDEGPQTNGNATIWDVHATTLGAADWGFAVDDTQDVHVYDLDRARTVNCLDHHGYNCAGTYRGRLVVAGQPVRAARAYAGAIAGTGSLILLRAPTGKTQVWDISGAVAGGDARLVGEVTQVPLGSFTMWQDGAATYLAVAYGQETSIYSVPCAGQAGATCTPALVRKHATPGGLAINGVRTTTDSVRHSRDGDIHYLFVGSTNVPGGGPQREYLFNINDPANPVEQTPQTHPGGYWGWYYKDNPTGFWNIAPYTGLVSGNHFYRAAFGLLDVHELLGDVPPNADFVPPAGTLYAGDTVGFTDATTAQPTSWAWDFDGNGTTDSTVRNPSWTIPAAGPFPRVYPTNLRACNEHGCDTATRSITVYDPDAPPINILRFHIQTFCLLGFCPIDQGVRYGFDQAFSGGPETFDYDWVGDGVFEDAGHAAPVTNHVYWTPGVYAPRLRIHRSTSEDTYPHNDVIEVTANPLLVLHDDFELGNLDAWSATSP